MKYLTLLFLSTSVIFFSACSSKRVYAPEDTVGSWSKQGTMDNSIIDITSNVALMSNRNILSKSGNINIKIDENYRVLSSSDGWIISSTIDGKLKLQYIEDKSIVHDFDFKKTVASASVKDDTLAVLFADNEMALYKISSNELILKFQGGESIALDSRIANPYFMDNLVIFSTLDGKVVIIDSKEKKKLRTVIISSEDYFNNVIYFNIVDNKVIAATAYKILSMAKKEIREKYEIRTIAVKDKNIFIATKQGEVISLTPDLQLNAKLKFPFAHFIGLIIRDEKVYILEKEGYLIEAPLDLSTYKVYDVDVDEGYVFIGDDIFYINDEYISVK